MPATQTVQLLAAVPEYFPIAQLVHEAADTPLYFPASQFWHDEAADDANDPFTHESQIV